MEPNGSIRTVWTLALFLGLAPLCAAVLDFPASGRDWEFGRVHAAHLLRRAGFGGSPEQVDFLVRLGRDRAVDHLVDYERIPETMGPYEPGDENEEFLLTMRLENATEDSERQEIRNKLLRLNLEHMQNVRAWWILRMASTARPLEEKMTLFWHGHFPSGLREVKRWRLLYEQNEFLRRNALADFRTLLRGISRDGAMLLYLDNARNVKGHPNENYARELLELFTLGEGNYSERDIREAARAFTGWGLDGDGFAFDSEKHDFGKKRIFGARGPLDGDEVIDLILKRKECPEYLARRLLEFFVYRDRDPRVVQRLARLIRKTKYDLREVLRAIFQSDEFYSEKAMFSQIKSPVELVVGTVRTLGLEAIDPGALAVVCSRMGQTLFQPPNVKGWDGDRKWITTNTLFARYNFAGALLEGERVGGRGAYPDGNPRYSFRPAEGDSFSDRRASAGTGALDGEEWMSTPALGRTFASTEHTPPYDPGPTVLEHELLNAEEVLDHYVERLLSRKPSPERYRTLLGAFSPAGHPFRRDAPDRDDRIRDLVFLVTSIPEYQVN